MFFMNEDTRTQECVHVWVWQTAACSLFCRPLVFYPDKGLVRTVPLRLSTSLFSALNKGHWIFWYFQLYAVDLMHAFDQFNACLTWNTTPTASACGGTGQTQRYSTQHSDTAGVYKALVHIWFVHSFFYYTIRKQVKVVSVLTESLLYDLGRDRPIWIFCRADTDTDCFRWPLRFSWAHIWSNLHHKNYTMMLQVSI